MASAKTLRRLSREFETASGIVQMLDAGEADHLFADAETKAHFRAETEARAIQLLEQILRADSRFEQLPNGHWGLRERLRNCDGPFVKH